LWEDGGRIFCRRDIPVDGKRTAERAAVPAAEHSTPATLDRLAHEYGLTDELDGTWAVRPLELVTTGAAEPKGVLAAVHDRGPGLTPAMVERVFDAFYTTSPAVSEWDRRSAFRHRSSRRAVVGDRQPVSRRRLSAHASRGRMIGDRYEILSVIHHARAVRRSCCAAA
jgi:hypothetical protein